MASECDTTSADVAIEPEWRRALGLFRQHGLMTVPAFAAVMWLSNPDTAAAEELLGRLCNAGFVERILRPVGPLRFGLTVEGLNKAWT